MDFKKHLVVLCSCLLFIENSESFTIADEAWASADKLYISYEPTSSDTNCRLASECAGLSEIIVDIDKRKEIQV